MCLSRAQDDDLSVEHLEHLLLLMAKKGQGRLLT